MASLVPRPRSKSKRTSLGLALAVLLPFGAAACGDSPGPLSPDADQLICTQSDLPENYLLQVTGGFTGQDLIDLSHDPTKRAGELDAAGFVGGSFNYWREIVTGTPFDPPASVLCEILEFESANGARDFVNALGPEADLDIPGLAWLPGGPREVTSPDSPDGRRVLEVTAGQGDTKVRLRGHLAARGRFVQAVYVGSANLEREPKEAGEIFSRLSTRTEKLTSRTR